MNFHKVRHGFVLLSLLCAAPAWSYNVSYSNSSPIEAEFSLVPGSHLNLKFRDANHTLRACTGYNNGTNYDTNLDALAAVLVASLSQEPGLASSRINVYCEVVGGGNHYLENLTYRK